MKSRFFHTQIRPDAPSDPLTEWPDFTVGYFPTPTANLPYVLPRPSAVEAGVLMERHQQRVS